LLSKGRICRAHPVSLSSRKTAGRGGEDAAAQGGLLAGRLLFAFLSGSGCESCPFSEPVWSEACPDMAHWIWYERSVGG
jgi:hypothetical protein